MRARERRRLRQDLSFFLEGLCLHVQAGYEVSHAWRSAESLAGTARPWLGGEAKPWKGLSKSWPIESHRLWFALLEELRETGAPLLPLLGAFSLSVRRERAGELDAHARELPGRLSLVLLCFYLPAAFLLLFAPLLLSLPAL